MTKLSTNSSLTLKRFHELTIDVQSKRCPYNFLTFIVYNKSLILDNVKRPHYTLYDCMTTV